MNEEITVNIINMYTVVSLAVPICSVNLGCYRIITSQPLCLTEAVALSNIPVYVGLL